MRIWEKAKQMFANQTEFTEAEIRELEDIALAVELARRAGVLSYYNAAESPQYGLEKEQRELAQARFAVVKREVDRRGLKVDLTGYLV